MTTWYSTATDVEQQRLLDAWADAPLANLEVCSMLLEVAKEQVIAYAPETLPPLEQVALDLASLGYAQDTIDDVLEILDEEPIGVRVRYVYAQLQQAANLWNAGRVDSDGSVGDGGFNYTPRPLDKTIRGIIRPVDGKISVL